METQTDLINSCISGNRNSQSRLYAEFSPKMFSICQRYSKNREEAEELLQEGFVQVFKSLKSFKNTGSFEGWIRKIMVHGCINHYRNASKMYPVVQIDSVDTEIQDKEYLIPSISKKELLQMVQALPPAYRLVFNLYVFEGMKHREIAEVLGISEGTSKSNFFDAKLILQKAVNNSNKIAK